MAPLQVNAHVAVKWSNKKRTAAADIQTGLEKLHGYKVSATRLK